MFEFIMDKLEFYFFGNVALRHKIVQKLPFRLRQVLTMWLIDIDSVCMNVKNDELNRFVNSKNGVLLLTQRIPIKI